MRRGQGSWSLVCAFTCIAQCVAGFTYGICRHETRPNVITFPDGSQAFDLGAFYSRPYVPSGKLKAAQYPDGLKGDFSAGSVDYYSDGSATHKETPDGSSILVPH